MMMMIMMVMMSMSMSMAMTMLKVIMSQMLIRVVGVMSVDEDVDSDVNDSSHGE